MRRTLTAHILMTMTLAALLALPASAASALTPTETVKSRVDEALQTLTQASAASAGASEQRRAEIRRAADALFDFTEMSRRALGRHWTDRTPAERQEFVRLFTDLIAVAYIGKIDRYAGESIAYTGERVEGDTASVRSQVVTAKGSQIPVEYRLHRVNESWTAYDVLIENVSLVGTYRSQFDRIIRAESFADLLRRLREKA
ncbi:MAG TPA: ABC transporter substrate-binding protein [Candidatus Deferrimicrobiaceae bacterium]|jgi:phospholipid transport system substrate-binding protein|nr:ABC transporter substrate-binding protein [Candidatus Deferrimicrobiaceae bacterium]